MTKQGKSPGRRRPGVLVHMLAGMLAGAMLLPAPALAQFSEGYRFLEAVKKKDGEKVESALNEPGSTLINTRDLTTGETALHLVTARRDSTWLQYLVSKGANVNARDRNGVTPLQLASNLGWLDGVEQLVARQARLEEANDAGETPLITAVHRRDLGMMRVLLKAGADPDRKDNSGRSARDYATLDGHSGPLISAIESGAKPAGQRAGTGAVYGPTF